MKISREEKRIKRKRIYYFLSISIMRTTERSIYLYYLNKKEWTMMKKTLALLLAALLIFSLLSACSKEPSAVTDDPAVDTQAPEQEPEQTPDSDTEPEAVTLKVWADQGELELTEKLCNEFAAAHPEKSYTFEYGAVGAVDGKTRYLEDPAAAADVFLFADDQLNDLVKADALYEVTRNTDAIIAANTPASIKAATYEGVLYGYPMTSDNGYFLFYDKSVFTDEDLATLDGILAAANKAGKQVFMDISNGWYLASFFIGNGCTLTIEDGTITLSDLDEGPAKTTDEFDATNFAEDDIVISTTRCWQAALATPLPAVSPARGWPPPLRKSSVTTMAAASCPPSPVTESRCRWPPSWAARSTASTPRRLIRWMPWSWPNTSLRKLPRSSATRCSTTAPATSMPWPMTPSPPTLPCRRWRSRVSTASPRWCWAASGHPQRHSARSWKPTPPPTSRPCSISWLPRRWRDNPSYQICRGITPRHCCTWMGGVPCGR